MVDPTPQAAYKYSGMAAENACRTWRTETSAAPKMAVGKRPYAVMGSVVLALTMIADVNCEEVYMGLFSARLPVIAVLHGDLFVGDAVADLNRKGTIDLRSVLDPKGKCFGSFRWGRGHAMGGRALLKLANVGQDTGVVDANDLAGT